MNGNTLLFLTYWYPNKNNKSFGIFIKRHAHAIKINNDLVILSLNIIKGNTFYKKSTHVFKDEANIETHQLYLESKFNKLLYVLLPLHYLVLKRYIRQQILPGRNISIIHSNIIFPCGIVGHWLAKKLNCRHIITEHWTKIDKFFKVDLYRFSGKKAFDQAGGITCVSKQLAATVQKHTDNTIHIVPNVIDSKEFFYDPAIKKNSTFTFIAAAHWGQHKNPFYFLEALKELHVENKIGDFNVVLAGDGEQINKIKQNAYAYKIDYKGNLSAAELNVELNKSHVFLHGSDFETFSVIIAEALMCGLPSVVSPVGIAPEVINPSNGFIALNTVADWKIKITDCCRTHYDHSAIATQLKGRYDTNNIGQLFNTLYSDVTL